VLVRGCIRALRVFPELDLIVVGDETILRNAFRRHKKLLGRTTIIHSIDVIAMHEDPATAVRSRPEASIVLAAGTVSSGRSFGLFSPGNTGATIAAATLGIGLLPGTLRAALATILPTARGQMLLLDVGAGVDLPPERYLCLGRLGEAFMTSLFGMAECRVCLLNIGEEPNKGTKVLKQTYALLEEHLASFAGNIEPSDIFSGKADVVLCDGFIGNIFIKLCEGIGRQMQRVIKQAAVSKTRPKQTREELAREQSGKATRQTILRHLKKFTDPEAYGGAPLLGVRGIVLVGHGKTGPRAIYNAIAASLALQRAGMIEKIESGLASATAGNGCR